MSGWYIILLSIFFVFIVLFCIFFVVRVKTNLKSKATDTKDSNLAPLNYTLASSGFFYSMQDDTFYSRPDCIQRKFGYCKLYDETMPFVGLIVDCEPIYFDYNNRHWLIEFWKGQFGMACGCQIGIYNTLNESIKAPGFHGIFYESLRDNENFSISYTLKKKAKVLIHNSSKQTFTAGLKLGEFSFPAALTLKVKITFPNKKMLRAFVSGLKNAGYQSHDYSVRLMTVIIHFASPHTLQPASRTRIQEAIIQQGNLETCTEFKQLTLACKNSLNKLNELSSSKEELYDKALKSFYTKELYSGYELIRPILKKLSAFGFSLEDEKADSNSLKI